MNSQNHNQTNPALQNIGQEKSAMDTPINVPAEVLVEQEAELSETDFGTMPIKAPVQAQQEVQKETPEVVTTAQESKTALVETVEDVAVSVPVENDLSPERHEQLVAQVDSELDSSKFDSLLTEQESNSTVDLQEDQESKVEFEDDLDSDTLDYVPFELEVDTRDNDIFTSLLLTLASLGVRTLGVSANKDLDNMHAYPVVQYLEEKPQTSSPTVGGLELSSISIHARLPDSDDGSFGNFTYDMWTASILNTLDLFAPTSGSTVLVLVSPEHARITSKSVPDVAKAFSQGVLVELKDALASNVDQLLGHDILIVCTRNLSNYCLRLIGDPTSNFLYIQGGTEEIFSPCTQVMSRWIEHLSRKACLPIYNVGYSNHMHEVTNGFVWREQISFNVIGDEAEVKRAVNPLFGHSKILDNLSRDASYEGRYSDCNISVVQESTESIGYLGKAFIVHVLLTHTDPTNDWSGDEVEDEDEE